MNKKMCRLILLVVLCSFCFAVFAACDSLNLPRLPGVTSADDTGSQTDRQGSDGGGSGSSGSGTAQQGSGSGGNQQQGQAVQTDTGERRTPRTPGSVLVPATGNDFIERGGATLDFSNANRGYIMVNYTGNSERVRVHVTQPNAPQEYRYDIWPSAGWQVIPLSRGNGSYQISVLRHVTGSAFENLISHTLEVSLVDQFLPFLYPNQHVNFNSRTQAVILAAEVVADARNDLHAVELIYKFVINALEYDHDFADSIIAGDVRFYVPNLDEVLRRGRGVCFDYASLMVAMLRAQRIPTRLISGFIPSGEMHAWVMIFTEETGWVGVAEFAGRQWTLMDPTFSAAASAGTQDQLAAIIGDGKNYQEVFVR